MSIFQHRGEVGKFCWTFPPPWSLSFSFHRTYALCRNFSLTCSWVFIIHVSHFSCISLLFFIVFLFPRFLCLPLSFTITPSSSASCGDGQRKKQGNAISCVFSNHRSEVNLARIFLSLKIQILCLCFS